MEENVINNLNIGAELDKSKVYMDKFQKAKNFNSDRKDAYAELMAFYQGNQHLLKRYKKTAPWVVSMNTPYATVAIDNRVSSLLANDYIGELLPLSERDVESVDILSKVYEKEWKAMELDDIVNECIKTCAVVRESYCHIVYNDKKTRGGSGSRTLGVMEAYTIDPSKVFIDPEARNLRDARYVFISDRIAKEEAEEKYDKLKGLSNSPDFLTPQDRGEVYIDNDYVTEQEDVLTLLTYYGKEKGKIKRVKIISGIIVDEKYMPIKVFPIAQIRWKKAAQSCYGLSLMDEVLSLQKAITSIESAITNTAMSYAAPSMMVRKGCGVDPKVVAKASGAPGVVYAVDGNLDNAIKPVIPPKIQQEILNIKTDFQNQIDKITGNSNQFLGDIGTAGNTSSGANIAVERAKIIEIDILKNIKDFIEDITNIVVNYIVQIYENEELTYNNGKDIDNRYQFTKIRVPEKSKLENVKYKYYIELDTKTPYSKNKQKELLLEIYQLERQYDTPVKTVTVSDIIKNTDLENKNEIISRFNDLSFQDAQTKAETINKLTESANNLGLDKELITQATAEIINNSKETPAVDTILQSVEEAFKQEMINQEQKLNMATDEIMSSPAQEAEVEQLASEIETP